MVEGSQQIAMARYVLKNVAKGSADLQKICKQNLDGVKLRDALLKFADYYNFDKKLDTYKYYYDIHDHIESIGNTTGICSPANVASYTADNWPTDFVFIDNAVQNGVYAGLGVKMPIDKLKALQEPIDIAEKSWWLMYMYFWSCFCALMLSLIVFLILIRRHKADAFDIVSIVIRCLVLGAGGAALAVLSNKERLVNILNSPAILPMAVVLMFVVLCGDKLTALWCNWRLVKSGEPYALEYEEEHHHGGHGGHEEHGEVQMTDGEEYMHLHHANLHRGRPDLKQAHRVSSGWGSQSDAVELMRGDTEYSPHVYRNSVLSTVETCSLPLGSPGTPPALAPGMGSGGYMPVAQ